MTKIDYKIESFYVLQSKIVPDNYAPEKGFSVHNSFSFDLCDDKTLLCLTHILMLKSNDKEFVTVIMYTTFKLTEESIEGLTKDNVIEIPTDFLVQCGSISYGSLRGIIYRDAQAKGLDSIIIPPFYVYKAITEPLVVELSTKK